jgi:hypothetical protein
MVLPPVITNFYDVINRTEPVLIQALITKAPV